MMILTIRGRVLFPFERCLDPLNFLPLVSWLALLSPVLPHLVNYAIVMTFLAPPPTAHVGLAPKHRGGGVLGMSVGRSQNPARAARIDELCGHSS